MTGYAPATADRVLGPDEPPRIELARLPTPLHPAPHLSAELGVPILFKRDDLTGFGLGGNKARGLEYLIADALGQGCDCLVTGAGPQSNWTMLAALSALRHGIEPHVVCYGDPPPSEGNLRLHRWLGVDVRFTGIAERASVDEGIDELTATLRATGRQPYVLPRGGATALGSLGYVRATVELADQLAESNVEPEAVWLPTGSCATQAGLLAGAAFASAGFDVIGVTVSRPVTECRTRIAALAAEAAAIIGGPRPNSPHVLDGHVGPGYGLPSKEGAEAAALVAHTEGVFLDPVFGAKAMGALMAECAAGWVTGSQVFLVTGGAPTLFTDRKGSS